MNSEKRLQNIWAMTDKPLVDIMTKKNRRLSANPVNDSSGSESSDSESLGSSCGSFIAVPKEFRPYLPPHLQETKSLNKYSANYDVQKSVLQNTDFTVKQPIRDTLPNNSLPENHGCTQREYGQFSFTNQSDLDRTSDLVQDMQISSKKCPEKCSKMPINAQRPGATTEKENGANMKENITSSQVRKKMVNKLPFQKQSSLPLSKKSKHKNNGNGLKYDYIEKQEHGTIHLNFEMPSISPQLKEELKYEVKIALDVKQQTEAVLKTKDSRPSEGIQDFKKIQYHSLYEESTVKWDSTLNLNDPKCNNQSKIKWTIMEEKNNCTIARKTKGKKNHMQLNNEFSSKSHTSNHTRKPFRKYYCKKKPTDNSSQKNANCYHDNRLHTTSKPYSKYSTDALNIGNLQLNNDILNYVRAEKENSDTERDDMNKNMLRKSVVNPENAHSNEKSEASKSYAVNKNVEQSFSKFMKSDENSQIFSKSPDSSENLKSKGSEEKNKRILHYGREMSDLIIGSHTALSLFISFYKEWKVARLQLIGHFEHLEKNLKESSKKYKKYSDIIQIASTSASLAASIPVPHVSLAARVVSVLTSVFSAFLQKSDAKKANVEDSNEITTCLLKDTDASSELYMYGLQCNQQFEETIRLIEEFHSNANIQELFSNENRDIVNFIRGVLEYKPQHRIFYKKLYKCYQELLQSGTSDLSRRFCEPFLLHASPAVEIIGFLDWRFHYEDFNSQSVRYELEELHCLIQGNNSITIKELMERIQNCMRILRDELTFVEKCVKNVSYFDNPELSSLKNVY